jgi:hypothetical protein
MARCELAVQPALCEAPWWQVQPAVRASVRTNRDSTRFAVVQATEPLVTFTE